MISSKHKFVFIHVPKTGGNSVQNILNRYSDDKIVTDAAHQDGIERFNIRNSDFPALRKHSNLRDYKEALGAALDDYFVFSTIRNPWEKLVSHFFSPHRGPVKWSSEGFSDFVKKQRPLTHYIDSRIDVCAAAQSSEIDYLMRFEHLQHDFDTVCDRIKIARANLPVRNKSERPDYRECYTDELAEYVGKAHRYEIEIGNYEFQSVSEKD